LAIGDRGAGLTHRIEPGRICALAEAIYGFAPEAYVVTVPIRAAGFGDGLSADARRQAEAAVEVVLALIGKADAVAVSPVMDSERSVRNRRWPAV
jgi:Ni,Fe-hydrogenase maturation factor